MKGPIIILTGLLLVQCASGPRHELDQAVRIPAVPKIDPDYSDLRIPCNIAPMNFKIIESGSRFVIRLKLFQMTESRIFRRRDGKDY